MDCRVIFNTLIGFLLLREASGLLIPSLMHDSSRLKSTSNSTLHGKATFTPPKYQWKNYVDIHQLDQVPKVNGIDMGPRYQSGIVQAVITVMNMLTKARTELEAQLAKPQINNPSLLRYGPTNKNLDYNWVEVMRDMITRYLILLGCPPWSEDTSVTHCMPKLNKIQFYYQEPSFASKASGSCNDAVNTQAYLFTTDTTPPVSGIVLCPQFFDNYRLFNDLDPSEFGPYYEWGYADYVNEPTFFSARIILHELLHSRDFYRDFFRTPFTNGRIIDADIFGPSGDIKTVYGAFYAQKSKEWAWVVRPKDGDKVLQIIPEKYRNSLWTVDTWVYFITEHYVKTRFELPNDWQDSPDRGTGPHLPPGHPPPAPVQPVASEASSQAAATTGHSDPVATTYETQVLSTQMETASV